EARRLAVLAVLRRRRRRTRPLTERTRARTDTCTSTFFATRPSSRFAARASSTCTCCVSDRLHSRALRRRQRAESISANSLSHAPTIRQDFGGHSRAGRREG